MEKIGSHLPLMRNGKYRHCDVRLKKDIMLERQGEAFENCQELFLEISAIYESVVSEDNACKWLIRYM